MSPRTFLLLFLLFAEGNFLFSQSLPQVIPPSPEASALGKYGEIPVGYNTGIPAITIPLYEFTAHDIKVPINLSYHASGIRVTEKASWVGLGWVINCSGVITRTVHGKPDEDGYRQSGYASLMQYYNGELSATETSLFWKGVNEGGRHGT